MAEKAASVVEQEVKTLVTHRYPDTDAWLSIWIAKRFIPGAADAKIFFVNSGETLSGSNENPTILHLDTGGGKFDHHGKGGPCSALLLARSRGIEKDPGLEPLLDLAEAADNVRPLTPDSIHYAIRGYPQLFRNDNRVDWPKVERRVFELFDCVYGQATQRAESREKLSELGKPHSLSNGLRVVAVLRNPSLRDAAFESGASVVVWTVSRDKGVYVGIQRNRRLPFLRLDGVAGTLRSAEGRARGINVSGVNLRYIGREGPVSNWFLYDNCALVLCGSKTWKLEKSEFTRLKEEEIVNLVVKALSIIPADVVSHWNR